MITGWQVAAIVAPILIILTLAAATVCVCVLKQRTRKKSGNNCADTDENPTYGDYYYDPNPTSEVEDSNAYYASDYEAGTGMGRVTDNNPLYE